MTQFLQRFLVDITERNLESTHKVYGLECQSHTQAIFINEAILYVGRCTFTHANEKNKNEYKDLTEYILEYTKADMVIEGE